MYRALFFLVLAITITSPVFCEQSPYTEFEQREIKALSVQQVADYRAGRGMGFALAAELNGYPGPKHVLELSAELALSPNQLNEISALFDSMQSAASALGEKIVLAEQDLDAAFANNSISTASLEEKVLEIGKLNGALRSVHLEAHLETKSLLSPEQVEKYIVLRGYEHGHHSGMKHNHDK